MIIIQLAKYSLHRKWKVARWALADTDQEGAFMLVGEKLFRIRSGNSSVVPTAIKYKKN